MTLSPRINRMHAKQDPKRHRSTKNFVFIYLHTNYFVRQVSFIKWWLSCLLRPINMQMFTKHCNLRVSNFVINNNVGPSRPKVLSFPSFLLASSLPSSGYSHPSFGRLSRWNWDYYYGHKNGHSRTEKARKVKLKSIVYLFWIVIILNDSSLVMCWLSEY